MNMACFVKCAETFDDLSKHGGDVGFAHGLLSQICAVDVLHDRVPAFVFEELMNVLKMRVIEVLKVSELALESHP
ncbi:MAG: hypothetical protein ACI9KE_000329 [Polyangiales bacterium]|jgi:hypothetical protein